MFGGVLKIIEWRNLREGWRRLIDQYGRSQG
jgi:hypothetical protein